MYLFAARGIRNAARMVVGLSLRLARAESRADSRACVLTFAESCTGGMLASAVTSVPGASAVFPGSAVTYGNRAKTELLSVDPGTIARHGAVSARCAVEMARGALSLFGAMMAVSVTGIAGPGGGTPDKPVGTVWFAAAHADGRARLRRGFYPGRTRRGVREEAVLSALSLTLDGLRYELEKNCIL